MFKATLFLACIVLMGSAIKDIYNETQRNNLRSFITSSIPSQIDQHGNFAGPGFIEPEVISGESVTASYNGAVNTSYGSIIESDENDATVSHTPLAFVETEAGQITATSITKDLYACPSGYNYLSYNDEVKNSATLCKTITNLGTYRLEGGGSVDGPGYQCKARMSDARSLGQAFCAKTTVLERIKAVSENCISGYDRASVEEVSNNIQAFCSLLKTWDIARIGFRGSISGPGYGCAVKEWHDDNLGHSACVKRRLDDVKVVQQSENICGTGKTLITAQEALANRSNYCYLLPASGVARLAGGASIDGPSYGCKIRYVDKRSLQYAICGAANR